MNQLVIRIKNVEKSYLSKEVLAIEDLKVYENEKIGIVGKNGEGKSTLLKLITGEITPDTGEVETKMDFHYYAQIPKQLKPNYEAVDAEYLARLKVPAHDSQHFSGGEQSRLRLADFFSSYHMGLLMDEPTTHLDKEGIQFLVDQLEYYFGTLLVVSHDRYFLDKVVDTIWEVGDGKVRVYKGNYSAYQHQKEEEQWIQQQAYEHFLKEKNRLEQVAKDKQKQADQLSQVSNKQKNRSINPGRLGSSKQKDTVQKAAHKSAKAIQKRAEQLEEVDSIEETAPIQFPVPKSLAMHNPFPIMGHQVTIQKGNTRLFEEANFQFPAGKRIGLIGPNGSGKSTLLQHIQHEGEGITLSKKIVFATYNQMDYQLSDDCSILAYLMNDSEYTEPVVRSVLNHLNFDQQEVSVKAVNNLSGGEATRLAIAKLFTDPSNVLLLDEPTNFIDLQTIEALEKLMKSYQGTILFISHDQYFTENVADQVWRIEEKKLKLVNG